MRKCGFKKKKKRKKEKIIGKIKMTITVLEQNCFIQQNVISLKKKKKKKKSPPDKAVLHRVFQSWGVECDSMTVSNNACVKGP